MELTRDRLTAILSAAAVISLAAGLGFVLTLGPNGVHAEGSSWLSSALSEAAGPFHVYIPLVFRNSGLPVVETPTSMPSATEIPIETSTPTGTTAPTLTRTPTQTPTLTEVPTSTGTSTATNTSTPTSTATATPTRTSTRTTTPSPTPTLPAPQSFTEEFSSVLHMDAGNTTAHWDTASGLLKLLATEPITRHLVGGHHWRLDCALPKDRPWTYPPCTLSVAPAVYVPETSKAYHISSEILEYDPRQNLAVPIVFSGPMPHEQRTAAAYASSSGKIYIFGGCDVGAWASCKPCKDVYEFDPVAKTNTLLTTQLPYGLNDAVAEYVPDTDKIYVLGGITPDRLSADILEFDVATHSLQVLSVQLPSGRTDACSAFVPVQNRIYLFGGRTTGATLDEILSFEPSTGQLTVLPAGLPEPLQRAAAAYVPHAGQVFIFSGEEEGGGASEEVYAFDVATGNTVQASYNLGLDGLLDATAIYAPESDWLVILGGRTLSSRPDNYTRITGIVRLRCSGSSLTQYDSFLPDASHTLSAVYAPEANKAYLFGGDRQEILEFDIGGGRVVTRTATLPFAMADPAVVWVPSQLRAYVFASSSVFRYEPDGDTLTSMPTTLPAESWTAAYVPTSDAIYLFDSTDGDRLIVKYDLLDGTLTTLDGRLPSARRGAYATYVPATDEIYLFGGWGYGEGAFLDEILLFDVATESISKLERKLPAYPGEYKASALLPGTSSIYLIGGWGGWSEQFSFSFKDIWQFDASTRQFTTLTLTLPEELGLGNQAIIWASAEDRFYTLGGRGKTGPLTRYDTDWIYRFECGHEEEGVAQSTRINYGSATVVRATLTATMRSDEGTVSFFLSADAGATWEPVTLAVEHVFAVSGSDLRWKAQLQGDGVGTPMIDQVIIEWISGGGSPPS